MATTTNSFKQLQIDYTNRDAAAIRDTMIKSIPFVTPEWTDHNATDFGIGLIELLAGTLDILHFYIDRAANEAFLPTALKRESVIRLTQLIDFQLRGAAPASADVTISIPVQAVDVTLPVGFLFQSISDSGGSPVKFELLDSLTIVAGQTSGTATITEGEPVNESLGVSDGLPDQRFELLKIPVETRGVLLKVFVDEGAGESEWTFVDSFIEAGPTDLVYTTETNSLNAVNVFFGDNVQGKIPVSTSSIRVEYRILTATRGAVFGNVPAGSITQASSQITVGGNPITVTVSNAAAASGGEPEQSIEEARVLAPRSLRALNRAVTAEDFKTFAEQFPGVAAALASPPETNGLQGNIIISVAPEGGGLPTQQLKDDLKAFLDVRKMVGSFIDIIDPVYEGAAIAGTVYVPKTFTIADVSERVNTALSEFFKLGGDAIKFGGTVFLSDVYSLIDAQTGVRNVILTKHTINPTVRFDLWSGTATVGAISVTKDTVSETWTIILTSATTFTITGSVSGLQQSTGTFDSIYTSDNSEVSFQITTGTVANQTGDRISFVVLPVISDIIVDKASILQLGSNNLVFQSI